MSQCGRLAVSLNHELADIRLFMALGTAFCKTNSVVRSIFYAISLSLEMKLTHSVREFTYRYSVDSYCTTKNPIQQEDNIRNEHL